MAFDPLTAIFDIGKTVLNKILPDKMSEAEKAGVEAAFQAEASKMMLTQDKNFRDFVLEYEGKAKDIPKGLIWIRSAIRPAFTILIGYLDYMYFMAAAGAWEPDKVGLLKAVNLIILFFWFGERAVQRSGVLQMLKK